MYEYVSQTWLVGGFKPLEKYARQIGHLPQIGVKIKNIWNHHLHYVWTCISNLNMFFRTNDEFPGWTLHKLMSWRLLQDRQTWCFQQITCLRQRRPTKSTKKKRNIEKMKRLFLSSLLVFSPPVRWGLLDFMSALVLLLLFLASFSSASSSCEFSVMRRTLLRPCEFNVMCRTSTAILWVQCGVPDLNRDPVSSVWRAGPQPRSCEFSVACRASTAILWGQCGVPDLNRDPASAVWRAGPQPRSCQCSVACRTSTAILPVQCGVPDLNRDQCADLNRDAVSSVWRAGPQPRSCPCNVACRTSTAILWGQCGVPDLNRDPASAVWRAGPQPRSCQCSVACRTSTAILPVQCGVPDLNRDPVSSVCGPQPRCCEFSVACRTSTAMLPVQCGVPDLNRDPVRPVLRARKCEWYFARLCVNDILHGFVWVMPGAMTGSASILWARKRIGQKRETCAAVSDEAEVLMLKQSVVLQQIGIPYCLEFTSRLLHFWS